MQQSKTPTSQYKPRLIKRISLPRYARLFLFRIFLKKISEENEKKGYPKLFCLPGDDIGQRIISSGLYEEEILTGLFDNFLLRYREKFLSGTALDVGANIGNHSCYFSSYFKEVIAFEPNDTVFPILKANISLNEITNVHLHMTGLSNTTGELDFSENREGNLGASSFAIGSNTNTNTTKSLSVDIGDEILFSQYQKSKIIFIKLDIEGFEILAIRGLEKTIRNFQPIIVFELLENEHNKVGNDIFSFLKTLNYEYFYSIEKKQQNTKNKLLGKIRRLLIGSHIYSARIMQPKNRYYSMIVASTECIQSR